MNHYAQTMRVIDRPGHTAGYIKLLCTGSGISFYSSETFDSKKEITCPKCLSMSIAEKQSFDKEAHCRLNQAIAYIKAYDEGDYKLAMEIEHDHYANYAEDTK